MSKTKSIFNFKNKYSQDDRMNEAKRILAKYHDRKPIIVERLEQKDMPNLDKNKYLVPIDLTFGQFLQIIRKRVNLSSEQALFMFVGEKMTMATCSELVSTVYADNADADGFLYVKVGTQETFG